MKIKTIWLLLVFIVAVFWFAAVWVCESTELYEKFLYSALVAFGYLVFTFLFYHIEE